MTKDFIQEEKILINIPTKEINEEPEIEEMGIVKTIIEKLKNQELLIPKEKNILKYYYYKIYGGKGDFTLYKNTPYLEQQTEELGKYINE